MRGKALCSPSSPSCPQPAFSLALGVYVDTDNPSLLIKMNQHALSLQVTDRLKIELGHCKVFLPILTWLNFCIFRLSCFLNSVIWGKCGITTVNFLYEGKYQHDN